MKLRELYDRLVNIYKETREFIDQLSLLIRLIQIKSHISKEMIIKTIDELKDIYHACESLGSILRAITWTENGKGALILFLRYKFLQGVPTGLIRGWIASFLSGKIIGWLQRIIPNKVKDAAISILGSILPGPKIKNK